jgi:hypothetical protein
MLTSAASTILCFGAMELLRVGTQLHSFHIEPGKFDVAPALSILCIFCLQSSTIVRSLDAFQLLRFEKHYDLDCTPCIARPLINFAF